MCETTTCDVRAARQPRLPVVQAELHRVNLKSLLESLDGRFVGVDFVKQDGSVRKLNGRLGVHTYLKGGVNTVEADFRPYLTVFDVAELQYRTVNLATVSSLRADRHCYSVIG